MAENIIDKEFITKVTHVRIENLAPEAQQYLNIERIQGYVPIACSLYFTVGSAGTFYLLSSPVQMSQGAWARVWNKNDYTITVEADFHVLYKKL